MDTRAKYLSCCTYRRLLKSAPKQRRQFERSWRASSWRIWRISVQRSVGLILLRLRDPRWRVINQYAVTKPRGGVSYIEFTGAVDNSNYRQNQWGVYSVDEQEDEEDVLA